MPGEDASGMLISLRICRAKPDHEDRGLAVRANLRSRSLAFRETSSDFHRGPDNRGLHRRCPACRPPNPPRAICHQGLNRDEVWNLVSKTTYLHSAEVEKPKHSCGARLSVEFADGEGLQDSVEMPKDFDPP